MSRSSLTEQGDIAQNCSSNDREGVIWRKKKHQNAGKMSWKNVKFLLPVHLPLISLWTESKQCWFVSLGCRVEQLKQQIIILMINDQKNFNIYLGNETIAVNAVVMNKLSKSWKPGFCCHEVLKKRFHNFNKISEWHCKRTDNYSRKLWYITDTRLTSRNSFYFHNYIRGSLSKDVTARQVVIYAAK